jgi:hypothetical protein
MTSSQARRAALRYVELVNDGAFDQVGSLFAPLAVVLAPSGEEVVGREAITALWAEQYSRTGPSGVSVASCVFDETTCALELSPQLPGEDAPRTGMVIDHFTIDGEGLISRLAIYLRPTPP